MKTLLTATLLLLTLTACGRREAPADAGAEAAVGHASEGHGEEAAGHEDKAGHLEFSPEQIAAAGVDLAQAAPADIREVLPLYCAVQPNAERVREVTARYPGVVLKVNAKIGDAVRQGQVLAVVESNESLRTYEVTAPLGGVVTARTVNPGETAGDAPLFTVADLSTVWVELALFPRDLAKVRVGQDVRVRSADTGLQDDGRVVYVSALGQAASQTLTARVLLKNAERRWAPGLYVTGDVVLAQAPVPVAVRSSALQTIDGKLSVFVSDGDDFDVRPVVAGRADADFTEVREGLSAGERYAATNSFVLKSELGKSEAGHDH